MNEEQTEQQGTSAEGRPEEAGERSGGSGEELSEREKAEKSEEEAKKAKEEIRRLEEEGPPEKLEDWPSGMAKYETFGGPEGEHTYQEGPEAKMGPSDVRHHEGGEVEVGGEKVEDPEEFKADPIPGGPTDPNSPNVAGEKDLADEESGEGDSDSEARKSEDESSRG